MDHFSSRNNLFIYKNAVHFQRDLITDSAGGEKKRQVKSVLRTLSLKSCKKFRAEDWEWQSEIMWTLFCRINISPTQSNRLVNGRKFIITNWCYISSNIHPHFENLIYPKSQGYAIIMLLRCSSALSQRDTWIPVWEG